jgi:hypothetical protein
MDSVPGCRGIRTGILYAILRAGTRYEPPRVRPAPGVEGVAA